LVQSGIEDAFGESDLDEDAALALRSVENGTVVEHIRSVARGALGEVMAGKARDLLWQMGIDVEPTVPERERSAAVFDYEHGLRWLQELITERAPTFLSEFHTLEARLLDNLRDERLYGGTETSRAERARVVDALNDLAGRSGLEPSFNDLCRE